MSDTWTEGERFLADTDPHLLEAAVAANHREFFVQRARMMHGEVSHDEGVTWIDPGPDGDPAILFPQLAPEHAGEQLDRIVQFYLARQPTSQVGCWSLDPPTPPDLAARLLARGFRPGWRPCWMALDLQQLRDDYEVPEGLRVELLEAAPSWEAPQLPYYNRAAAAIKHAMAELRPRQLWHFVAYLGDEVVGQSLLFVTHGPLGVAGIYDVGVVPDVRNRGIGKAVTAAACRHARNLGCRQALLNATGEGMYRQLGFERIGYGWTWWLDVPRLNARPPSHGLISLAEAVGRGDINRLAALGWPNVLESLDAPLTNGMTLLEVAAHFQQSQAAEWLVEQGATLDVLVAWDLGWKDRVIELLAANPELANRQGGEMGATPLHEAVRRDDRQLAQALLAAQPDLTIKDTMFASTPLDWAKHMQRTELVALLERHQDNPSSGN